jgi:hypothetical protein
MLGFKKVSYNCHILETLEEETILLHQIFPNSVFSLKFLV